eukprot:m.16040 g.16040  ORF g.16040 m.16040 type:complete len:366 (+) comp6899_c0_seq1:50-1147(+)
MATAGDRATSLLNAGGALAALAVAHQTGVLEALARLSGDGDPEFHPVSSIARECECVERYVKEVLRTLAVSQWLEVNDEEQYKLPLENAKVLTVHTGGESCMAAYLAEMPMLLSAGFAPLCKAFKTGEGIPYAPYEEAGFYTLMDAMTSAKHEATLVQKFIQEGFPEMHSRLEHGATVLDVGCGTGTAVRVMAEAYKNSTFVGLDIAATQLENARKDAAERGLQNCHFVVADAAKLEDCDALKQYQDGFDWITAFDAIHDQTRPLDCLKGVYAVLKQDGYFSMVDIKASSNVRDNLEHPMASFIYAVSLMHCMPVGMNDGGPGLGAMWGHQVAETMLRAAGFSSVQMHSPPKDAFNTEYRCRKGQ